MNDKYRWMDRALCREVGPDLFHPEVQSDVFPAKAVCRMCDVKEECLQYGLDNPSLEGVLGGTSQKERILLRRRRRNK